MWYAANEKSPAVLASMKASQINGQFVYKYVDPIEVLEAKRIEQRRMF